MPPRRFLEYPSPCPDPIIVRSVAEFQLKTAEPAGRAYHERLHGKRTAAPRRLVSKAMPSSSSLKPKLKMNVDLGDYYGLLRVPIRAAVDDIRRAYREVSLVYHPDKNPDAEHIYKAIQEAHTTLTDLRRRRVYDSTLPFDDSIPSETLPAGDAAFYATFGPVFERNAWFSEVQPAPLLGDAGTSFADLDAFYDFWFGFRSWRDFSADCEHKPELAENREERRWMEKENQKVTNAKVKAEAARVRKLVDRAFKLDPRVKAQRALDKAERQARKREKAAQRHGGLPKKDQEEAELARQQEDARKAAEAEAAQLALRQTAKKAAHDEKRLGRTLRKGLRETIQARFGELLERNGWLLDDLFAGLSVSDLQEFAARLAEGSDEVAADHIGQHARRAYQ